MTTSSAQETYSITSSNDVITIDLSNITGVGSGYATDTITLTNGGSSYTIGSGIGSSAWTSTSGTGFTAQTISSIDPSIFTWKERTDFVDCFPDFNRVKAMCEQYPGLQIVYEKFVTTYNLVKDDYDKPASEK